MIVELIYRLYVLKCITSLPAVDVDRGDGRINTTLGGRQGQIREDLNPHFLSLPPIPPSPPPSHLATRIPWIHLWERRESREGFFILFFLTPIHLFSDCLTTVST